jgi:hypothetical protein
MEKCEICNKNYSSKTSLYNHNKKFHPIIEYKCTICNKIYNNYNSKWHHEKICKLNNLEKNSNIQNQTNTLINPIIIKKEYIYLLQEREFIKNNENIYKIGRTQQENLKRLNNYPKNSVLLFQMICNDSVSLEKKLIELFNSKYIKRTDIGIEYFEGNYCTMINDIYENIKSNLIIINEITI